VKTIVADLRSDTVTRPTAGMLAAMCAAPTGDDVFGDDPTVLDLQDRVAQLLGFEAALFLPTGTMSNLCALMAHCQRGDEVLVGQKAHTYKYEAGGAAVLGSIQPQPLEQEVDGSIALDRIAGAVKPDDPHFARTRLLALENTFNGRVLPQDYLASATGLARELGLASHLDGARLFNAACAQGLEASAITEHFDSVSVCLSKGLGTPAGSVLAGSAELIARAHRIRKMLGGGMRQAGILAAAGLYALDHHVDRLALDHDRAARIADALTSLDRFRVVHATNMVWVEAEVDPERSAPLLDALVAHLRDSGIEVLDRRPLRLVTHLDIAEEQLERILEAIHAFATYLKGHAYAAYLKGHAYAADLKGHAYAADLKGHAYALEKRAP